ncbi:MAG: murein biosynthesis integral membrane protein MurJ [Candidatus Magasanikbacteria bacterium]|nr:murein biosynthesis integral membrane protein MurJ [Candidatus Magasanikbacteria bacterium]
MIRKIINNQTKTVTGAAIVIGAASFVSKIMAVARDRIFAHQFGADEVLDIYFAAFRIPDTVYNLLVIGALSAGFIPVFTKLVVKDRQEAWKITNSMINIIGLSIIGICTILYFFTPQLVKIIVPGFGPEEIKQTVMLTRIMFLSPFLLGLSSVISGALQSLKSFFVYSLTPIMYNFGIIFGALALVPFFGIKGLAFGVIIGAILHLTIQLPTIVHHGFKYKFIFNLKNKHVKEIGKLMIPRTMGLAVHQVNWLVMTMLASTLAAGSIAVFNYANNLQFFPVSIIGISFALAAFPTLSKLAAEGNIKKISLQISGAVRQILFFIIPIMVIFMLLRAQIVRIVLGTGQFDWQDTILTMNTLAFFALSLFAQCIIPLLARGFYALHDTWTPFFIGIISAIVNIVLGVLLKQYLGVVGLAFALSISMIIQLVLLWVLLRIKIGGLNELSILQSIYKISIAAIVMALVIQLIKPPLADMVNMTKFWGILIQGMISGAIGTLIYLSICYILKLKEIKLLSSSMKKKFLRVKNVQGEVGSADEI